MEALILTIKSKDFKDQLRLWLRLWRLMDLIQREAVDLSRVSHIVLDETDEMLTWVSTTYTSRT